jgi:hypothetical protein
VDANQNENKPVEVGDGFISLDIKSRAVFYEVEVVEKRHDGSTWIKLAGLQFQDSVYVPLLFLDKSFAKVNKSTIQTLFGERKKNGNAKQETSHAQSAVKSIRREGQRRTVAQQPTRVVETGKGHRARLDDHGRNPKGGNRSTKRN